MSDLNRRQRLSRTAWIPLVALLAIGLIVGLSLGDDYGMSWDEERNYTVGFDALQSYLSPQRYQDYLASGEPLAHHGPAYFMLFALLARGVTIVNPGWHIADGRHLANYLTFLLGIASFYALALRLMPRRHVWMATALIATQPLLFGHAFINQKDTPFMAFFLASVAAGLAAVDRAAALSGTGAVSDNISPTWRLRQAWAGLSARRRAGIVTVLAIGLVWLVNLAWPGWRLTWVTGWATAMRDGTAMAPLRALAAGLVRGMPGMQPDAYLEIATWMHDIGRLLLLLVGCLLTGVIIGRAFAASLPNDRAGIVKALCVVLLAGALLGFAISIRQIGAFAGLLVCLYGLRRTRAAGLWLAALYGLVAAAVTLATWPYLWADPLHRFWETLALSADFEIHMTPFRGQWVFSDQLPWDYFPTLAAIQLTLPAVALFGVGLGFAGWRRRRGAIDRDMLAIALAWLGVPLFALIVLGMSAYNNLRQLHFAMVPIFLIAGVGLSDLMARVRKRWGQLLLLAAVLLPGVVGIVRLHPYEYTYYNALTGGTAGAEGQYAIDYWCTSYREAMAYVNAVAEPGAKVMAMGPLRPAMAFARSDLEVLRNEGDRDVAGADYLVTCYRWLGLDWGDPNLKPIHRIEVAGATIAEVFHDAPP